MEQIDFGFSDSTKLDSFSKEDLIKKYQLISDELARVVRENYKLRDLKITDSQLRMVLEEQLMDLQDALFGQSSERYKKPEKSKTPSAPKPRVKKPSERYPNIPVREILISMNPVPDCESCGEVMSDSGMTEDSEQLTVIPKKYEVLLTKRVKYRCSCHGCIQTAPNPPRITEGSTYSDEMILDVVLSKYCDLIPIERYVAMAGRSGLMDLPPHSLIELTHAFSDFVEKAYDKLKACALSARVLRADETPHKMLEGSDKKSWFLWGFSSEHVCFFECHDTRSGDVASEVLTKSNCEVLMSDVYTGYNKATRIANEIRKKENKPLIQTSYCNAHARRYFFKSWRPHNKDPEFYLDHYHEIYQLDGQIKGKPPDKILELRAQMKSRFEAMKIKAHEDIQKYPKDTKMFKATRYPIENYDGLTLFLQYSDVPIDNNSQERLQRGHVVGRKTWYGTHSERGAKTAAVLFSLVESCKLIGVNPREYFKNLVQDLLVGREPYTPKEFKDLH